MDGIKEELLYACCFCNEGIESSKVNPADIIITTNFDKTKNLQYSQTFFCHIECFQSRLHSLVKMHFHLHNILDE